MSLGRRVQVHPQVIVNSKNLVDSPLNLNTLSGDLSRREILSVLFTIVNLWCLFSYSFTWCSYRVQLQGQLQGAVAPSKKPYKHLTL